MTKREFTQRNISRFYKCLEKQSWILGYEPAGLTVHPPPPRMIEGGFIFFRMGV